MDILEFLRIKKSKKVIERDEYNLGQKIEDFLDWYLNNIVEFTHLTDWAKDEEKNKIRYFIEKMAVWYELRYPDYEIDKLLSGDYWEQDVNEVMFRNNELLKDVVEDNEMLELLNWNEFYSTNAFVRSLPVYEREYLKKPRYPKNMHINYQSPEFKFSSYRSLSLCIDNEGKVKNDDRRYLSFDTTLYIGNNEFNLVGMHIKDVLKLLKDNGLKPWTGSIYEVETIIQNYENDKYFIEELLNCILYRIILRGRQGYGAKRGYLFAKEFALNLDIPMIYGMDNSIRGIKELYNTYLKDNGNKDLMGIVDYFLEDKENPRQMMRVEDFVKSVNYWTDEEQELGQRLVNLLSIRRDMLDSSFLEREKFKEEQVRELAKREKIEQQRLQRRLARVKRNEEIRAKNRLKMNK